MSTINGYAYDEQDASPYDKTVLAGVFDTPEIAKRTLSRLHEAGFHDTWMGIMRAGSEADYGSESTSLGSSKGVIESADTSVGASLARFFGEGGDMSLYDTLVKRGVPSSDALALDHHMHPGGAVITVKVDERYDEASEIIRSASGSGIDSGAQTIDDGTSLTLSEERLTIDKERVAAGEATISKKVVAQTESVDVPVMHEEFFISRRPVTDQRTAGGPIGADQTIRIPLMRDRVVVDKRTYVTEEVEVGKRAVAGTQTVSDTVRHEELVVDKDGSPAL